MARHHLIALLCVQALLIGGPHHKAHADSDWVVGPQIFPIPVPDIRLALGPGWSVPAEAPATTDLFLTLTAGVRIGKDTMTGFFFRPEMAYSFRHQSLGSDHQFNIGLGLGYSPTDYMELTYTPYFVAGHQNALVDDLPVNERALGFRHGLRFTLASILSLELSHQFVALESDSQLHHDLRLLAGIDFAPLVIAAFVRE